VVDANVNLPGHRSPQVTDPSPVTIVPPDPGLQTSPPPAAPEDAAQNAELAAQNAELRRALGDKESKHAREMAELNLKMDALALGRGGPPAQALPEMPAGIDPETSPTWQEFHGVLNYAIPRIERTAKTQAIRSTWDVTPLEESEVVAKYGSIVPNTEPERAMFVQKAVKLMRDDQASAPAAPTSAQGVAPSPPQTRPQGYAPPVVESNTPPRTAEPVPTDHLVEAQKAYVAADEKVKSARTDAERREALKLLRVARDRIYEVQGISEDAQKAQGFKMVQ
jgi:hypothetical protein